MQGKHFIAFSQRVNQFNNSGEGVLDSIHYDIKITLKSHLWRESVRILLCLRDFVTASFHNVIKICKPIVALYHSQTQCRMIKCNFYVLCFSLIPGLFDSLRKEGTDFADPDSTVSWQLLPVKNAAENVFADVFCNFYTPPHFSVRVLCYTFRCLSVRLSVCAHHFRSIT